ncbi:hypothetical protein LOD99_12189 [Oopsacas minuta]|uniref:TRAF-type domain-containing protein n=1 Tax=Oopsacas minuta TaxID=111878 RepID=A0AAV7JEI3_9METZ|nr:hypothetical protein LOD99_12189 [Oopsacas minuta]
MATECVEYLEPEKGILRKAYFSATSGEYFCKCCKNLLEQAEPNGQVRKIVHSLKSSCPLYKRGCEGIGKLGKAEKHLNICEYVYEQCKLGCEIVLPRHELQIHMREHCVKREITCEYCDQYFKVCDMGYHMNQCDKMQRTRELGCDTVMCHEIMAQHLENSCRVEEECKLGCGRVLPRNELKIHISEECYYRKILCEHCQRDFKVCEMRNHLEECPAMLLKCELKCGTVVCREDMAQHLEKYCRRGIEHCKLGCGIELSRDELEMHVNDECVQRMMPCEYCHIDFKACDMSNHNKKCQKMPISCELGCDILVCREDKDRHIEEECVEKKVECPFIKYKCEVGLIKRKELNQHLKEKRTEHTELKLRAMEETVMKQSEMIRKQSEMIAKQNEMNDKQSEMIAKQSERICIQNEQLKTLFFITNTIKLEWRIPNVVKFIRYCTPSTFQQFQVDRFNFTLELIYDSIYIHYPRQELSKVKVHFIFRIINHNNSDVIWESKGNITEIKQTGGDINAIAKIPAREEFIRDDGIDLEILVTLL